MNWTDTIQTPGLYVVQEKGIKPYVAKLDLTQSGKIVREDNFLLTASQLKDIAAFPASQLKDLAFFHMPQDCRYFGPIPSKE